jgi:signal peptidase I
MKKIFYGALIGFITALVIISVNAETGGAPILTYVYSNSMEPLIKVNDAFIVHPASDYKLGDIVMYRPVVLKAPYITHRIIAIGETGYITKGDNSPYRDQESGEPEVPMDRIAGRVLTVNGLPVILPGLGKISTMVRSALGNYSAYLSIIFLVIGILSVISAGRHQARKPKSHRRWRLRHLYRVIIIIAAGSIMVSIYLASRVSQLSYLVSEYPGSLGDQIEVNKPGQLMMKVSNRGFLPVWTVLEGIEPLSIPETPDYILPRSSKPVVINVQPQPETGIYQGYVQIYHYPIVLPKSLIMFLHRKNPLLAVLAEGLSVGFLFTLFFRFLNSVHGFEDWIPLRTMKDKILNRRLKRMRATLLGRRRTR